MKIGTFPWGIRNWIEYLEIDVAGTAMNRRQNEGFWFGR
jgi:hypothetical protein